MLADAVAKGEGIGVFECAQRSVLMLLFTMMVLRTRVEKGKLAERFGDEYRRYIERTGAFFPRL